MPALTTLTSTYKVPHFYSWTRNPTITQPITAPLSRASIFLTVTLNSTPATRQTVRSFCADLSGIIRAVEFRSIEAQLSCILSFGSTAWDHLFGPPRPAELHPFREFHSGPRHAISTPADILSHIRARHMDMCFELATQIMARISTAVSPADEVHQLAQIPVLPPAAAQVSQQIGLTPLLEKLAAGGNPGSNRSMDTLLTRQEITERVLSASLDIDGANAVIDYEIERIRSIRSDLQSKRDRAQNVINIASLLTGGTLGVASTALQFKASTANIGNGIRIAGGATSVAL